LVALANTTRLSLKKGAHAALANAAEQEIRVLMLFLPAEISREADSVSQIFFILKEFGPYPCLTSNSLKLATV
jgi:hypothetical protein